MCRWMQTPGDVIGLLNLNFSHDAASVLVAANSSEMRMTYSILRRLFQKFMRATRNGSNSVAFDIGEPCGDRLAFEQAVSGNRESRGVANYCRCLGNGTAHACELEGRAACAAETLAWLGRSTAFAAKRRAVLSHRSYRICALRDCRCHISNSAYFAPTGGAPGGIRTPSPRIRSPMLCPVELRALLRRLQKRNLIPRQRDQGRIRDYVVE